MKYSTQYRRWADPTLPMAPQFGRISYALFRTDDDMGRIIAARCPNRNLLSVGSILQEVLHISDEAMAHLNRHERDVPLFILSDVGLGILWGRYVLSGGMGLFLHVHCHPAAGARLVNSGVMGVEGGGNYLRSQRVRELGDRVTEQDAESYPALMEAWQMLHEAFDVFKPRGDDTISLTHLHDGIRALAAFAGCDLTYALRKMTHSDTITAFRQGYVHCYDPRLLEAQILCLLTEMRDRSATRGGVCRLEVPEDNGVPITQGHRPLRLAFRYPVLPKVPRKEAAALSEVHGYAVRVGNAGGMGLHYSMASESHRPADALPTQIIWLEWVENPALLTTTDVKAGFRLRQDEEEPPDFVFGEEIPWEL